MDWEPEELENLEFVRSYGLRPVSGDRLNWEPASPRLAPYVRLSLKVEPGGVVEQSALWMARALVEHPGLGAMSRALAAGFLRAALGPEASRLVSRSQGEGWLTDPASLREEVRAFELSREAGSDGVSLAVRRGGRSSFWGFGWLKR